MYERSWPVAWVRGHDWSGNDSRLPHSRSISVCQCYIAVFQGHTTVTRSRILYVSECWGQVVYQKDCDFQKWEGLLRKGSFTTAVVTCTPQRSHCLVLSDSVALVWKGPGTGRCEGLVYTYYLNGLVWLRYSPIL